MELKPTKLCFNEKVFFKDNFSVDEFLTEHRRIANLETLRDDLGIFLKNLRSSTIELINKDYADFVDLSSNLVILQKSITGIETPINKIQEEILEFYNLFDTFLLYLKELFLKSIQLEKKGFTNCLRLYFAVNKVSLAHEIVRQEIVSPKFGTIINEESLRNEPSGLEGLYSKILTFIDRDLKFILNSTQLLAKESRINEFDIMVYSIWPELEERLEFHLKSIYSPGNPDTFFNCYAATLTFLDQFENRCFTCTSVRNLRNLNSYHNFLHCWNLPVYYTLRFQEYGGKLEKVIYSHKYEFAKEQNEWKLLVSEVTWSCLLRCWDNDVFIRQLAHRFWKFNLQILARYTTWIENILEAKNLNHLPTSKIDFLIYLYSDGNSLIKKFPILFDIVKERIGSNLSEQILNNMQKCLQESERNLQNILKNVENKVIELLSEKNVLVVRQVSDIPRLYRRTNRETPTHPCTYVSSLFAPIHEMQKNHLSLASNWIPPVLSAITTAYYEQVADVLTSVQRTEESLRKFKKIRDPSNLDNKNNTDDDKIRLQLQIDIEYYINAVKNLTNSTENIVKLQDLNEILKSLKRT
ncbi:hypothetical protein PGB90_001732 [Kerria lacca]